MYRVAKKTTKGTKGYCLKCPYHKVLQEIEGGVLLLNVPHQTK